MINKMREDFGDQFSLVVLSQDWHCPDHVSFASQHPGVPSFSEVDLTYTSNGKFIVCAGGGGGKGGGWYGCVHVCVSCLSRLYLVY